MSDVEMFMAVVVGAPLVLALVAMAAYPLVVREG